MDTIGPKKKKIGSPWQILVVFLVISALILTFWMREGDSGALHSFRSGFTVATSPLSRVGAALGVPFRAIGNAAGNSAMSGDDVQALKDENEELRATVEQLEEYRQEDQRLTDLLKIQEAYNLQSVGARVIGRTGDSYNQTITLDKGSSDGLTSGMPVMNAHGLIGQIESITSTQSTVRLIFDSQSSVSVMIQSTRVEGILQGSSDGLLYLNYIPVGQQVAQGDVILTSGTGGVYPKGIIIGQVTSVTDKKDAVYHTIVVTPLANNDVFEEVLVVTGRQTEVTYNPPVTPSPTPSVTPSPTSGVQTSTTG